MIYYNLITPDGTINKKLFEDCFIKIEKNNVILKKIKKKNYPECIGNS